MSMTTLPVLHLHHTRILARDTSTMLVKAPEIIIYSLVPNQGVAVLVVAVIEFVH